MYVTKCRRGRGTSAHRRSISTCFVITTCVVPSPKARHPSVRHPILAASFGGTDGHKYVNGVLDRAAAQLHPLEVQAHVATR